MNKYMGTKATTQSFIFEIPEERRTVAIHAQLQNTRLQINPILAAASLMMTNEDIDKVTIGLLDATGEMMGLWVEDTTQDEEKWVFSRIVIERERLLLTAILYGINDEDAETKDYELPRQAFMSDLMNFLALNDTTILNPPPAQGELVQQKFSDNEEGFWDQTDDPLRFSTLRMKTGVDFTGWMEDAMGNTYLYVDYQRDDNMKEPEDDSVVLADAELYLLALRDPDDDGHVEIMPYDELMVGSEYDSLILTPNS